MKILLPLLFSLGAFFAFRAARPALDEKLPGLAEVARKVRPAAKGLERRAERLSTSAETVASLELLHRAGRMDLTALQQTVRKIAASDPAGAWNWVEGAKLSGTDRAFLLREVASVWFDKDPEQVLLKIPGRPFLESTEMACSLINKLKSKDPAERENLIAHLDQVLELTNGNRGMINLMPYNDEGGSLLLSLPPGRGRDILIEDFANQWLGSDPLAANAWIQNLPAGTRDRVMEQFTQETLHPHRTSQPGVKEFALEWLTKEASEASRKRLGPLYASLLAKDDPAAAMEWASSHLGAAPLAEAAGEIVMELYARDPEGARRMVEELPPGNLQNLSAYDVAEKWLATEPAAAAAWWIEQVKGSIDKSDYFAHGGNRLAQEWIKTNPDSYCAFLADPASGEIPMAMIYAGVSGLVAKDKEATFDWLGTLPKERRDEAIKAAYQSWSHDAPAEAASAFDARPHLATADAARQIAASWFQKDAQAATGWIATLPWGGTREAALAGARRIAEFEVEMGGTFPEELKVLLRK